MDFRTVCENIGASVGQAIAQFVQQTGGIPMNGTPTKLLNAAPEPAAAPVPAGVQDAETEDVQTASVVINGKRREVEVTQKTTKTGRQTFYTKVKGKKVFLASDGKGGFRQRKALSVDTETHAWDPRTGKILAALKADTPKKIPQVGQDIGMGDKWSGLLVPFRYLIAAKAVKHSADGYVITETGQALAKTLKSKPVLSEAIPEASEAPKTEKAAPQKAAAKSK